MIVNEACKCHGTEKIGSKDDIDKGMKLGGNWSKGPFEIGKQIGFQKIVDVLEELKKESGNELYTPDPCLLGLAKGTGCCENCK